MFRLLDATRRQTGELLGCLGYGPRETPSRVVAEFDAARLRAYQGTGLDAGSPIVLLIPAPFKRHYIWDLMPGASVVRTCLDRGVRVYLLEWLRPCAEQDELGLDDYADRLILDACQMVKADSGGSPPILAGHSLGGTFAAICATLHTDEVAGIILMDAPLSFGHVGDQLAHEVALSPPARIFRLTFGSPVPGSAITMLSVAGMPDVFIGQPAADRLLSWSDPAASTLHLNVLRWTLDEFPMPGRLFENVFELLYRRDLFARGALVMRGQRASLERLQCPILAVLNPMSVVVPPASIRDALRLVPRSRSRFLCYDGDRGSALQHLGPLVTPTAHEQLWPQIIDWVREIWGQR